MKNKTKLVLGLAALTAVTAGVATTSTFAWFTTSRTATITFNSLTAYSDLSSLKISYVAADSTYDPNKATNGDAVSTDQTQALTIATAGAKVTDISGNGCRFFQKAHANADYTSFGFAAATNAYDSTNTLYYTEFGVTLYNTGKQTMKVYMGSGTAITAHTDSNEHDKSARDSARLAIINASTAVAATAEDSALTVYQPSGNDSTVYVKRASTSDTEIISAASINTDVDVTNPAHTGFVKALTTVNSYSTYDNVSAATTANATVIATPAANSSATVWVRVWLDGTSSKCTSDATTGADSGVIDLALDFYGLSD